MAAALILLAILNLLSGVRVDVGRLSVYRPGDGWNRGELACGGNYSKDMVHVAHREWRRLGCGRRVYVCAETTGRCVLTQVRDAGPWGIYRGPLKNAVSEGRWRVWTKSVTPPSGWRFRAVTDLSWALWIQLGRPRALSKVRLIFLPRGRKSRALIEDIDEAEGDKV
jgi:hypothetical protein